MKNLFIDSNILIDYLSGKDVIPSSTKVFINPIVYSEVLFGLLLVGKSEKFLQKHLSYLNAEVLDISQNTATIYTREKVRLRLKGKIIQDFDLLIASSCLEYKIPLLTENKKHFIRVKGLKVV